MSNNHKYPAFEWEFGHHPDDDQPIIAAASLTQSESEGREDDSNTASDSATISDVQSYEGSSDVSWHVQEPVKETTYERPKGQH